MRRFLAFAALPMLCLGLFAQQPAQEIVLIEGEVVNAADGTPVPRGAVAPRGEPGGGLSAPVNSLDGLFVVRGLKPSTYSIGVFLRNGQEAEALIDLNLGTNIVLKMPTDEEGILLVQYVRQ